jgi:hypothetical protein
VGSNTSSEVHHTLIFERDKLVSWIKKKGKSANEDLENETRKLNK